MPRSPAPLEAVHVIRTLLAVAAVSIIAGACGGDAGVSPGRDSGSITIAQARDTLNAIGDTLALFAERIDSRGGRHAADSVVWRAPEGEVATVSESGVVTARAVGTARIVAARGAEVDTAYVVVRQVFAAIRLRWAAETLFVADSITLPVVAMDSNDVDMPMPEPPQFTTDDPSLVTHEGGGVFRAVRAGIATLGVTVRGASRTARVLVEGEFRAVAAGGAHTCGLLARGAVYCWGDNTYQQLGQRDPYTEARRPRIVPGLPPVTTISAGDTHSCALTADGRAYCWGDRRSTGVGTPVRSPEAFTEISAGYVHSCAVAASGTAYCWGWNQDGQVGGTGPAGSGSFIDDPVPVPGQVFRSVAAGVTQSCGVTAAGAAYCWGAGFGPRLFAFVPARTFRAMSLGSGGICGVLTDGGAFCADLSRRLAEVPPVGGLPPITAIDRGDGHSCALTEAGVAYCWGANWSGQLGNGSTAREGETAPGPVAGDLRFSAISAGGGIVPSDGPHSCGVSVGVVYCWGANTSSQLGVNPGGEGCSTGDCRTRPVRVGRLRRSGTEPF